MESAGSQILQAQWHLAAAMPLVGTPPKQLGEGKIHQGVPMYLVVIAVTLLFIVESLQKV